MSDSSKHTLSTILEPVGLKKERTLRRRNVDQITVHPTDAAKKTSEGWQIQRSTVRTVRLTREKSPDRLFEDRVWLAFQQMGYPELNEG